MAFGQELFQLALEAVADAVVAGVFAVVRAGENMVSEFVNNRSAGAQLESFMRKKLNSELMPGQDI